ncbi:MoaD/ThiS family protein [Paraburkholderia megapolitana]|uniref:MoaD/ThiS family protein n=1 Tax=Paraburkholderia megapolitana TaxID=420953 RepID=UPI001C436735|nr:MoaD/ThiS family protein [Paraburkholderia megapolitana]
MIQISLPSQLKSLVPPSANLVLDGTTLRAALRQLVERFPLLNEQIFDERGAIREFLNIFVEGEVVEDMNTPLRPGADVQLIMAVAGG